MTFPSKAFLLTTFLAAHVANPTPFAHGEVISLDAVTADTAAATTSTTTVNNNNNNNNNDNAPFLDELGYLLHTPAEYLQLNSPSIVLSPAFPSTSLHALYLKWNEEFRTTTPPTTTPALGRTTTRASSSDSERERASRKLIWLSNHERIERHNDERHDNVGRGGFAAGHRLAHNDFSDMTNDEFRRRFYLGEYSPGVVAPSKGATTDDDNGSSWISSSERKLLRGDDGDDNEEETDMEEIEAMTAMTVDELTETLVENNDIPEYKNWNEEGAVTKVKNQWFCGACWAFSAIGAIEGARYIQTGNLTELSIQQLIDCDKTDLGCGGGLMYNAFSYDARDSVGLCALDDYPYAYHRHWFWGCQRKMSKCTPLHSTKVQQYVNVSETEEALKGAIAVQPVSVAVAASGFDWQFYAGGVFRQDCDEDIDHGVLAVGFGHYDPSTDPSATSSGGAASDYWLIKNSWGSRWGVDGFMQLGRGTGNEEKGGSACILTLASRPIMKTSD